MTTIATLARFQLVNRARRPRVIAEGVQFTDWTYAARYLDEESASAYPGMTDRGGALIPSARHPEAADNELRSFCARWQLTFKWIDFPVAEVAEDETAKGVTP